MASPATMTRRLSRRMGRRDSWCNPMATWLFVYRHDDQAVLWESGTRGTCAPGTSHLELQNDGHLVLYGEGGSDHGIVTWKSDTDSARRLVIQNGLGAIGSVCLDKTRPFEATQGFEAQPTFQLSLRAPISGYWRGSAFTRRTSFHCRL
jgi:hypothetical protein